MDFRLNESQTLFQRTVRQFCDAEIAPQSREIDTKQRIPSELLDKMGQMGLFGTTIPEEFGGGGDLTIATLGAMEMGRADVSMATAVYYLLVTGWSRILAKFGTQECKQELLPDIAAGKKFLGIASTEAGGGSDVANLQTIAVRESDHWVINGSKAFISGVTEAVERGGGHLLLARTTPGNDHRGISLFYVPAKIEGMTVTPYQDMGRMGISTCEMHMDGVRIPSHYLLGEEGKGFYHTMEGFNVARNLVAAACVGAGERGLEMGMEYIKQRQAFGKPLGKFESVQFELSDHYAELELVKTMVMKGAWMLDEYYSEASTITASELTRTIAIVKLRAPQMAFAIYKSTMMWFGAAGYTKEYDVEMGLRGIMSYLVGAEGALNIMRVILGRELLGKDFIPYK